MKSTVAFTGFPRETIRFYRELKKNNSKLWLEQHRDDYEAYVMAPARAFVREMGDRLASIAPGIIADPRVNHSIFKIHRDTRFSNDKTPLKEHLALWFWEGTRPRMECSGFYFHLEPSGIMLGTGVYMFPKDLFPEYRDSVVHPKHGAALAKAVKQVTGKGYYVGGEYYKKVPRGYDPEHANAEYLRYGGFYAGIDEKPPAELASEKLLDFCLKRYRDMLPVHRWLADMVERSVKNRAH